MCSFIRNINKSYAHGDIEIKLTIIGLIFPGKLIFEDKKYRTTEINLVVELMSLSYRELQGEKIGMPGKKSKHSYQVALAGRISNQFIEDLKRLRGFIMNANILKDANMD